MWESWQAHQLSYHSGPQRPVFELVLGNIYPIYELLRECEGATPEDPKLQDLHDTGQHQDTREESWGGSNINSVAQSEASKQTNDSLQ